MLQVSLTPKGYLQVIEQQVSAVSKTTVYYWYYDMQNWTKSVLGKKDEEPSLPMSVVCIKWVKDYYLPKVKNHAQIS
jgi:hypothetical protein